MVTSCPRRLPCSRRLPFRVIQLVALLFGVAVSAKKYKNYRYIKNKTPGKAGWLLGRIRYMAVDFLNWSRTVKVLSLSLRRNVL